MWSNSRCVRAVGMVKLWATCNMPQDTGSHDCIVASTSSVRSRGWVSNTQIGRPWAEWPISRQVQMSYCSDSCRACSQTTDGSS